MATASSFSFRCRVPCMLVDGKRHGAWSGFEEGLEDKRHGLVRDGVVDDLRVYRAGFLCANLVPCGLRGTRKKHLSGSHRVDKRTVELDPEREKILVLAHHHEVDGKELKLVFRHDLGSDPGLKEGLNHAAHGVTERVDDVEAERFEGSLVGGEGEVVSIEE